MKIAKILSLLGIVAGVFFIIAGINCMDVNYYSGGYLADTSFGADFYTYQYKATRIAAQNVTYLGDAFEGFANAMGWALMGAGILSIGCSLKSFFTGGAKPVNAAPQCDAQQSCNQNDEAQF
ncbi:MAG: hypothetical protein IJB76_04110 [Clostridia bacterium]|nr:hypothetical protein [Clostridia bacterium]MBQ4648327.1 hypothetical protein [Clostridia bacterium]